MRRYDLQPLGNKELRQKEPNKTNLKQQSNYDGNGAVSPKKGKLIAIDNARIEEVEHPLNMSLIKRDSNGNPLDAQRTPLVLGRHKVPKMNKPPYWRSKEDLSKDDGFYLQGRAQKEIAHKINVEAENRFTAIAIKLEDWLGHQNLTKEQRDALHSLNGEIDLFHEYLKGRGSYVGAFGLKRIANFESELARIEYEIQAQKDGAVSTQGPIAQKGWNLYGESNIPQSVAPTSQRGVSPKDQQLEFPKSPVRGYEKKPDTWKNSISGLRKTTSIESNLSALGSDHDENDFSPVSKK